MHRLSPPGFVLVLLLALLAGSAHADRQWGESCLLWEESCAPGLSCQPGVLKCFNNPRQFDEPCAAGIECGENLNCHPGVQKCLHVPRGEGEACSAGYDCDVGMQCASGEHICTNVQSRGEGAFCDGVTRQCADGYNCNFYVLGILPIAGTGRCTRQNYGPSNSWVEPLYHGYSRSDSEGDWIYGAQWASHSVCKPNEIMVGLQVDTQFFSSIESVRTDRTNWQTISGLSPICVATNNVLGWAGLKTGARPDFSGPPAEGPATTALVCPAGTQITHIRGTHGRAIFTNWNANSFIYSLQLECSDGSKTASVGGFDYKANNEAKPWEFDLTCPSWRFVANGFANDGEAFPLGGDLQLKTSSPPEPGGTVTKPDSTTEPGPQVVKIYRNLVLDCADVEKTKAAAAEAAGKAPPPPAPNGGDDSLGTLPGEIACNRYMDKRYVPDAGRMRQIVAPERQALCRDAPDTAAAALRIWCFGQAVAGGTGVGAAAQSCGAGQGPQPASGDPAPTWPPPDKAVWERSLPDVP